MIKIYLIKKYLKNWLQKGDCNETRTHNHLFCKRTLNHSAKVERFKDILELSNGIKPDDSMVALLGKYLMISVMQ